MYRGVITHNTILTIFGRYKINIIGQFEYKLPSEKQPFFHHRYTVRSEDSSGVHNVDT